jgi:hypothetical protein
MITGGFIGAINFVTDKLNVFCEAGNQLSYIIPTIFAFYKVSVLNHTKKSSPVHYRLNSCLDTGYYLIIYRYIILYMVYTIRI